MYTRFVVRFNFNAAYKNSKEPFDSAQQLEAESRLFHLKNVLMTVISTSQRFA